MSSYLSMMESRLPPGFRFHPRDEELCDYLAMKIYGDKYGCSAMIDIDLNKCEPWDLPETARVAGKEWYFFSLRDRKYATGQRTNRATLSGYWKATGKDRHVTRTGGVVVGMRKTLVFYLGRAPKGRKTDWVMHEFRLMEAAATAGNDDHYSNNHSVKEDWVLCRVFHKNRSAHSSSSPKPDMETTSSSYEDIISSSSSLSLPPLMDQSHHQTYINFGGQSQLNFEEYEEQVPCFSNTVFQISTSGPLPMASRLPAGTIESSSMMPIKSPHSDHTRNKDVIREVLNTITKLEENQKEDPSLSLGEGSIDSYLCENSSGFLPIW